MSISGKWEGKLVDASEIQAAVTVALQEKGGKVAGDFAMYLLPDTDEQGCCDSSRRLLQSGPVTGKFDKKSGRVTVAYDVTIDLKPIRVLLEGRVTKALEHAKQAIVACYGAEKGRGELTLEGGGVVLWQYAR